MPAGRALAAEADDAAVQREVIDDHQQVVLRVEFVEVHRLGHGQARAVHVRRRLHQHAFFTAHGTANVQLAFEDAGVELVPCAGDLMARGETVNEHIADVVAGLGVFGAGVAQADDEFHFESGS